MVRAHTSERQLCPAVREQVPTLPALGRGGMQALWLSLGQPPCMIEPASAGFDRRPRVWAHASCLALALAWHWHRTGTELALDWHWTGTGLAWTDWH